MYDLKGSRHLDRMVTMANAGYAKENVWEKKPRTVERSLCFPSKTTHRLCCASMHPHLQWDIDKIERVRKTSVRGNVKKIQPDEVEG